MNTGIQDAHNLAWKIACLLKAKASSSIIKTYEAERKPVTIYAYVNNKNCFSDILMLKLFLMFRLLYSTPL